MHRQSQDEVAAAARRRLELLGRELEQAGLRRVDDDSVDAGDSDEREARRRVPGLPEPEAVAPVGRHARPPRPGLARKAGEWLRGQVPETLRGRTEIGSGAALLVVALVALALAGTVVVVLRMHGDSEPVPAPAATVTTSAPSALSGSAAPAPGASASAPAATAGGTVTVDVSGKVRHPGVTTLPVGSRVVDAVRKAGGAKGGVDLGSLNLARVLVDGEQILVGRGQPGGGIAAGTSTTAPSGDGPLVNLNTATESQLDTLPGVGPV